MQNAQTENKKKYVNLFKLIRIICLIAVAYAVFPFASSGDVNTFTWPVIGIMVASMIVFSVTLFIQAEAAESQKDKG